MSSDLNIAVCGASNDPVEVWNRVQTVLNPMSLKGDSIVRYRYFGNIDLDESFGDIPMIRETNCLESPSCVTCPLRHHCQYHRSLKDPPPKPSTADLFSGAGGLSLGFEQAGFEGLLAIDLDKWAIDTHRYNRPRGKGEWRCTDLNTWLEEAPEDIRVDVLMGGPPCQSFSTANRQRRENDDRDGLYQLFIDSIPRFSPKVLLIENVKGFEKVLPKLCGRIEKLGYLTMVMKLNARDFGMPQNRVRLFTIGVLLEHAGGNYDDAVAMLIRIRNRIEKEKRRELHLIDAIGDLPELNASRLKNKTDHQSDENGWSIMASELPNSSCAMPWGERINQCPTNPLVIFNHKARYNNDRDIEIFDRLLPGEDSTAESIRDIMPYSKRNHIFKDKYYKLRPDAVCKTITAHMRLDCNMYIHPYQARGLTVREAARIQGFPDTYVFLGTLHSMYSQVGNAVSPPLARILAHSIIREL